MRAKELKMMPFEYKMDTSKRTIQAYASTFGNKDHVGDVVEKGAFAKSLKERGDRIKLLWQHAEPLGKPLHMEEDSKGLYVEAYISKTTLGNDVMELVNDGVIDRLSIGYNVMKDKYDTATKTRRLKELRLSEFSLVTFPANDEAVLQGVKSLDQLNGLLKQAGRADLNELLKKGIKAKGDNRELIERAIEALRAVLDNLEPEEEEPEDDDPEAGPGMDTDPDDDQESASIHSKNGKEPLINKYSTDDLKAIIKNFKL